MAAKLYIVNTKQVCGLPREERRKELGTWGVRLKSLPLLNLFCMDLVDQAAAQLCAQLGQIRSQLRSPGSRPSDQSHPADQGIAQTFDGILGGLSMLILPGLSRSPFTVGHEAAQKGQKVFLEREAGSEPQVDLFWCGMGGWVASFLTCRVLSQLTLPVCCRLSPYRPRALPGGHHVACSEQGMQWLESIARLP